jgi:hypothetical protein
VILACRLLAKPSKPTKLINPNANAKEFREGAAHSIIHDVPNLLDGTKMMISSEWDALRTEADIPMHCL